MPSPVNPQSIGERLQLFLESPDPEAAALAAGEVLTGDIDLTIRRIVTAELGRSRRTAIGIDDVIADVRLQLLKRLHSWRMGEDDAIENLAGYTRTLSVHACYGYMRREFPERARLRNKIRYVLTHHPSLDLKTSASGEWFCSSRRLRRAAPVGSARTLVASPLDFAARLSLGSDRPVSQIVTSLLDAIDVPIELDAFVDAVATILHVSDAPPAEQTAAGEVADQIADDAPSVESRLEHRDTLRAVWSELTQLPLRQRAAILLNLRDADGSAMLQTLPSTGVASTAAIAGFLEMSEQALATLWLELPLDDLTIAARLGITRQQVINLRKSGRARLMRRLGNTTHSVASTRVRERT